MTHSPPSVSPDDLSPDHLAALDAVVDQFFADGEPVPIRQLILAHPPEQESDVRANVRSLAELECVEVKGFLPTETLKPTARGVLLSKHGDKTSKFCEALVRFFQQRLGEAGARFEEYSWEEVKQATPVRGDEDFHFAFETIRSFRLCGGKNLWSKGPPPHATWSVPDDIVAFRTMSSMVEISVRIEPAEGDAGVHHPEPPGPVQPPEPNSTRFTGSADPSKVFVIHGRNLSARREMGIFLRSLGLKPLNFEDVRSRLGGTPTIADIVEAGMDEAQGVIALFTPDEYAALRPEYRTERDKTDEIERWQSRPNVIFEAGMAFGRDRDRVVFVLLGDPRLFTDVAGIHVLYPTNDPKGDRSVLRNTLAEGMQCSVELKSNDWMNMGDFEGCVPGPPEVAPRDPFCS